MKRGVPFSMTEDLPPAIYSASRRTHAAGAPRGGHGACSSRHVVPSPVTSEAGANVESRFAPTSQKPVVKHDGRAAPGGTRPIRRLLPVHTVRGRPRLTFRIRIRFRLSVDHPTADNPQPVLEHDGKIHVARAPPRIRRCAHPVHRIGRRPHIVEVRVSIVAAEQLHTRSRYVTAP